MAQFVSGSASNVNSKIRSSDPAGNEIFFRLDSSILNRFEIHLNLYGNLHWKKI